jgi:hypothetical protein
MSHNSEGLKMKALATAAAAWLISAAPAISSSLTDGHFTLSPMPGGAIISMTGDIKSGDSDSFNRLANRAPGGIVVVIMTSSGGDLIQGLQIGETIKNHEFATLVDGKCYSACAYAWLAGGQHRGMIRGSEVIFHSPYRENDVDHSDGTGNMVVGQYLAEIGIDLKTSVAITGHGPHDYYLLSASAVNPIVPFMLVDGDSGTTPTQSLPQQRGNAKLPNVFAMYCHPNNGAVYGVIAANGNNKAKIVSRTGKIREYEVFEQKDNPAGGTFYVAARRPDQDRILYFAFDYSRNDKDVSAIRVKGPGYDSRDKCAMDWSNTK